MEEYKAQNNIDDNTLPPSVRISIQNASLSWGFKIKKDTKGSKQVDNEDKDINLQNITLEAKDAQLTVIVGSVG